MRPAIASALGCVAVALGGCGGDDDGATGVGGNRPVEGGTLHYALSAGPDLLDPLLAGDRASRVVTRQVHEPLVAELNGPFGDVRRVSGPARSWSSSGDATIWRFRLRSRIRFGDGTPFNATAVLVNADRWLATPAGRSLLPGLVAVDAPRPDRVRFILDRADTAFPVRLARARLGLVSPRALRGADLEDGVEVGTGGTGTGAFELREQEPGSATVLARNVEWWGTRLGLGPTLDQVVFPVAPAVEDRVAMLTDGQVDAADDLGGPAAGEVRRDPLLAIVRGGPGSPIGIERSVRGMETENGVPVLSGVWLTTVGVGR